MNGLARYGRLLLAFARFSLIQELAFRGNFLIKVLVEVLWLTILLIFYDTIFSKTETVTTSAQPYDGTVPVATSGRRSPFRSAIASDPAPGPVR